MKPIDGDFEARIQAMRQEMLGQLKANGKVWTRGESLDRVEPTLRVFIEKKIDPRKQYSIIQKKKYPVMCL